MPGSHRLPGKAGPHLRRRCFQTPLPAGGTSTAAQGCNYKRRSGLELRFRTWCAKRPRLGLFRNRHLPFVMGPNLRKDFGHDPSLLIHRSRAKCRPTDISSGGCRFIHVGFVRTVYGRVGGEHKDEIMFNRVLKGGIVAVLAGTAMQAISAPPAVVAMAPASPAQAGIKMMPRRAPKAGKTTHAATAPATKRGAPRNVSQ